VCDEQLKQEILAPGIYNMIFKKLLALKCDAGSNGWLNYVSGCQNVVGTYIGRLFGHSVPLLGCQKTKKFPPRYYFS